MQGHALEHVDEVVDVVFVAAPHQQVILKSVDKMAQARFTMVRAWSVVDLSEHGVGGVLANLWGIRKPHWNGVTRKGAHVWSNKDRLMLVLWIHCMLPEPSPQINDAEGRSGTNHVKNVLLCSHGGSVLGRL